jgi:hypothetical protein
MRANTTGIADPDKDDLNIIYNRGRFVDMQIVWQPWKLRYCDNGGCFRRRTVSAKTSADGVSWDADRPLITPDDQASMPSSSPRIRLQPHSLDTWLDRLRTHRAHSHRYPFTNTNTNTHTHTHTHTHTRTHTHTHTPTPIYQHDVHAPTLTHSHMLRRLPTHPGSPITAVLSHPSVLHWQHVANRSAHAAVRPSAITQPARVEVRQTAYGLRRWQRFNVPRPAPVRRMVGWSGER